MEHYDAYRTPNDDGRRLPMPSSSHVAANAALKMLLHKQKPWIISHTSQQPWLCSSPA